MRSVLIDLNDVELRVARGTDELARSPGYATLVNQKIEVGDAGFAHAWLLPRQSSNRHWQLLDTTPVTTLGKRVRHAGDLAYLHLEHLRERAGRPDRVVLLVPGAYQRAQLSLLLGIAQAVGLTVDALIDSAVAAGATLPPGRYVHVEALLHHTVLTHLEVDDQRARRVGNEIVADTGIVHFERRIIDCIVEAFLKGSRFDPLHEAVTEQLLHGHLAQWLALLAERAEIELAIDYHGVRHTARLTRAAVCAAVAPLRARLQQRVGVAAAVLDYRLARVPGVLLDWPHAQALPGVAALVGGTASPDLQGTGGQGVALRTELAVVAADARVSAAPVAVAAPQGATHLLAQHVAYPLSERPLHLTTRGTVHAAATADSIARVRRDPTGAHVEVPAGASLHLNGRLVEGTARLQPGDHLTVAGTTTLFVPIVVQTVVRAADAN